ncbi:TetR/AcrR family transcriptional regulator [Nonomuraea pusilla]|uniref:Transcriptional regulator, TetR family n=1 Tax=Nonomuraea pusilla TaxID=46177 RepID=A0A1H8HLP2_9ACTN|nr:TetR/AcrR family transcriptional regulator [Nonomuraea pusilla]SEN56984.1 transcriptional regulator, TetR family [Nonomuraea pusilla]
MPRTPRGTLSHEAILERAGGIMDAEGLEAVTVRRLAQELGVRPMALYTYFRGKEEILSALYDRLLASLELPDSPDAGLDGVRRVMSGYFRLLSEHPALMRAGFGGEGDLRVSEVIYTLLLNAGLDRRTAVGVAASLVRFTMGSAAVYPERRSWDDDADHWNKVRGSLLELPADRYPVMRSFATDLPEFTQQEVFEFGVDLILRAAAPG